MTGRAGGSSDVPMDLVERQTLCLTKPKPNHILHAGDDGFKEELAKWYRKDESNAAEQLIALKRRLQEAHTDDFWTMATEGFAELAGAQYGFISKRVLVDEEDAAVEMPPVGQMGECLMSQAFYWNDGHGKKGNATGIKYFVYGCPCEQMKHDKVFVIPEELSIVIPNNPNQGLFPFLAEGYLAVPITFEGKCFAHFGVMWSQEGLNNRKFSLSYIEMMFHALEDTLRDGFLERGLFAQSVKAKAAAKPFVPHQAVTAAQSLKPYARSLSHELRTPMQGVVGMLDIMYATVRETLESLGDPRVREVFETLKENIEVVQDSSRRAVEAADNVVHAYDMNMGLPLELSSPEYDSSSASASHFQRRPEIVVTGDNIPLTLTKGAKRRRASNAEGPKRKSSKRRKAEQTPPPLPHKQSISSPGLSHHMHFAEPETMDPSESMVIPFATPEHVIVPGVKHTDIRDMLQFLVFDLLKVGGRPESAIAREIEGGCGEEIEVITKCPNGTVQTRHVKWLVDPNVPETILIDEKDLAKMISCVFLNAIKFTEEGTITLHASMSPKQCYLVIRVMDTGPGIPDAFLPSLFKAFSKEDAAITRRSEGLGLGLLVAKGLARKLGGDLACIRSATTGPARGTEFEMRLPTTPVDSYTKAVSPFTSPAASRAPSRAPSLGPTRQSSRSISKHPMEYSVVPNTSAPSITAASRSPAPTHIKDLPPQILQHITYSGHARRVSSPSPAQQHAHLPVSTRPADSAQPTPIVPPLTTANSKQEHDRKLAEKHPLTFLVVEDNKINRRLLVNMLNKLGYKDTHEAYDGADAVRCMERLNEVNGGKSNAPITPEGSVGTASESEKGLTAKVNNKPVDVILMDLWMPYMDGYEASERILAMDYNPTSAPLATSDSTAPAATSTIDYAAATATSTTAIITSPPITPGLAERKPQLDLEVQAPTCAHAPSNRQQKPTILAVTADVTGGALERAHLAGMRGFLSKPYKIRDLERLILEYCSTVNTVHAHV